MAKSKQLKRLDELPSHAKQKREENADKARIKQLEGLLEKQSEHIDRVRESRFKLSIGKRRKAGNKGGDYCRVIIPDTHGCFVDPAAIRAFLDDLEEIQPSEVICLGDHLDCGGFLAQHQTLGYVAEAEYTFEDDCSAANSLFDEIQKRVPGARIDVLEGNHERRIEKWIVTQTLRNKHDAGFLRKMFAPEVVLHMEKRGISYYNQGRFYDGLRLPATIKRGPCHFTHGEYCGQHAASQHLRKYGGCVVFAHTHRADSYMIRTVSSGEIGAWNPGCLCQLQRLWNHTNLTDWSHGYGLEFVRADQGFLHVNVPILDGVSYLSPLFRQLGKKSI